MDDVLTLKNQGLVATTTNGYVRAHENNGLIRVAPEALELARERGMERELHELVAKAVELFPTLTELVVRVDFAPWLDEAPVVLVEPHYWVGPGCTMGEPWFDWIGWKRDHYPFEVAETFMMLASPKEGPRES